MGEQRVEAVERALSILEAFGETADELSLAELAEETGLYKSTILRLAASLGRYGYLVRGEDGRYRLGPSLWRLGSLYRRGFDLGEAIRPELRGLVEATGETASFNVRESDERVCLYREHSRQEIRHHLDEGTRLPLDRGAAGHVLRAFTGGSDEISRQTRAQGFAISIAERSPDVAAVAAPVLSAAGELRGALAVSGLTSRLDARAREKAVELVIEAASRLRSGLL